MANEERDQKGRDESSIVDWDWQPIKTAPHNEEIILGYFDGIVAPVFFTNDDDEIYGWYSADLDRNREGWFASVGLSVDPTYWVPMPKWTHKK